MHKDGSFNFLAGMESKVEFVTKNGDDDDQDDHFARVDKEFDEDQTSG